MFKCIHKTLTATAIVAAATLLPLSTAHAKEAGVKVGVLKCDVEAGASYFVGSSRDVSCLYSPSGDGKAERYSGDFTKYGVDIGYVGSGVMIWAVFAPSEDVTDGALTGHYAGATADVAAGAGLGANVLIGGGNSVALQPVSINGAKGINIAAGLGVLDLHATE